MMATTMKPSGEHRRGRSMGSTGTRPGGEKDEDLALFHEMKRREKHNFLHPSPDDLDATLSSKFGGMGAPMKKVGNDLLTSESDKNDYDWLLTPPGTPLFPSLDQEAAALAVLSPALSVGSYSSASSATRSMKSSHSPAESVSKVGRGNPSPRRPTSAGPTTPNGISRSRSSPSTAANLARPSTPTSASGTRPSTPTSTAAAARTSSTPSVRASAPNLKLTISHSSKSLSAATTPTGTRPSTPTPRSSTPPVRSSTPGGRSSTPTSKPSTPTMRRSLSGGRTGLTSPSTTRGAPSPKRTTSSSRGNSPSAKRVTSVITSIAGMSSEAPPNLRTTVTERPSSTGKTNSNGSRPGNEANYQNNNADDTQNRRRPRSPSVTRSFSSSSSQDQRTTSSQTSRGSVISSYDDGLEVNRPSMASTRNSSAGKWHAAGHEELLSAKANAFAKRVTTTRSSVPPPKEISGSGYAGTPTKKASDSVKRPVDAYQNSPTSAYRHLHSSSPGSPFFSARSNSLLLRPGSAMNSSVTTSSNASSEHGTTVALDTEGSERDEDDLLSWDSYGRRASTSPRRQADILVLDKDDEKAGMWQDSPYERANSNGSTPPSRSQSTIDAEVSSFYETDGIASLEMLEQLGLMGGGYKKGSPGGRLYEKRTGSGLDDSKIAHLRGDEGARSKLAHRLLHEVQGSPGRHLPRLERQESSESLRKSRNLDAELLLKRDSVEKVLGFPEVKPPNSEIQAACLFVRDFKVGVAPPPLDGVSPLFMKDPILGSNIHGMDEVEMKLRNDLSYDWDKTMDMVEQRAMGLNGEGVFGNRENSKLSDSPIHVSHSNRNVASLEPSLPLSLEDPFISRDAEYITKNSGSVLPSAVSKRVGLMGLRKPGPTLHKDVDLEHPISMNRTTTGAVIDSSCVHDGVMDESEPESVLPQDVDLGSHGPKEYNQSSAMIGKTLLHKTVDTWDRAIAASQVPDVGSGPSDNGGCSMDEDVPEVYVLDDDAVVHGSVGEESEQLETADPVDLDVLGSPKTEDHGGDVDEVLDLVEFSEAENQEDEDLEAAEGLEAGDQEDDAEVLEVSEAENQEDDFEASEIFEAENQEDGLEVMDVLEMGDHQDEDLEAMETVDADNKDEDTEGGLDEYQADGDGGVDAMLFLESENEEEYAGDDLDAIDLLEVGNHGEDEDEDLDLTEFLEAEDLEECAEERQEEDPMGVLEESALMEVCNQQEDANGLVEVVQVPEKENEPEFPNEVVLHVHQKDHDTYLVDSGVMESSEGENGQQLGVHSKGDCLLDARYTDVPESDASSEHGDRDGGTVADQEHNEGELLRASEKFHVDVNEGSDIFNEYSNGGCWDQESGILERDEVGNTDNEVLTESLTDFRGSGRPAEETQETPECGVEPFEITILEVEPLVIIVPEVLLGEGKHVLGDDGQESSQSVEYFDTDSIAVVDDNCEEVSSGLSKPVQEVQKAAKNLRCSDVDSVNSLDALGAAPKDGLLHKENSSLDPVCVEEAPDEGPLVEEEKLSELSSQQLLDTGVEGPKINQTNIQMPKSVFQSLEKHGGLFDLASNLEDGSRIQLSKPGFRSASTLCAALEEQIAGLIQKIDHAIEESSKPFSSSQQEGLLVKDKLAAHSSRDLEQDDSGVSIRSSQEEDLLDMLWAEDDESSCSEGSRDQDFSIAKDVSQREMNGVRSSRLSDRGLPVSHGQRSEAYESVLKSSLSDLGSECSSRRSIVGLDQYPDTAYARSIGGSPGVDAKNSNCQYPTAENLLVHSDLRPEVKGNRDDGALSKTSQDLFIVSSKRESDSDSFIDSSGDECEDDNMKTAEEFFPPHASDSHGNCGPNEGSSSPETDESLHAHTCQQGNPNSLTKVAAVNGSSSLGAVPFGDKFMSTARSFKKENCEEAPTLHGHTGLENSRSVLKSLPQEDNSVNDHCPNTPKGSRITSNGNGESVEPRDLETHGLTGSRGASPKGSQVEQDQEKDESPILLTLMRFEPSSKAASEAPNEERWLHKKGDKHEVSVRPVTSVRCVSNGTKPLFSVPQSNEELEALQEGTCRSHLLMPEAADIKKQGVVSGKTSTCVDSDSLSLNGVGTKLDQDSLDEKAETPQMEQSPQHEVRVNHTGTQAEEESKNSPEKMGDIVLTTDVDLAADVIKLTECSLQDNVPGRHSAVHSEGIDVDVMEEDLFMLGQESPQITFGVHQDSPGQHRTSCGVVVPTGLEGQMLVEEDVMSQGHVSGDLERVAQNWISHQKQEGAQSKGQHISLISGNKVSKPDGDSLSSEDNSQVERLGRCSGALSTGADAANAGGEISVSGDLDVGKLSVRNEVPAVVDPTSPRVAGGMDENSAKCDELSSDQNGGIGVVGRWERCNGVGNQSARRLPSSKAKSVRTISSNSLSHNDSTSEHESPEGVVKIQKTSGHIDMTVTSLANVQRDHISPVDDAATKTRNSPGALTRSMTLAEATDTILYCSSLMHTIVYKAAAYAIEKEELAALASNPTSNGEALHIPSLSEVDHRDQNDSGEGEEPGVSKGQTVASGPASVRRSLSYLGHQMAPSTPEDTSLQIPVNQVIEKVRSPEVPRPTTVKANQKDVVPVKVPKSKCGCTIM